MSYPTSNYAAPEPGGSRVKTAVVAGALVALVAANIYLYVQISNLQTNVAKMRDGLLTEIANLRETSSVSSASARHRIETLKNDLEEARRQASAAAGQAKTEAVARAEVLAKKLADEQQRQQQLMKSQISQVKQATDARIEGVSGDVSNVKTQVASTKSELEKTIADLKRVTGDMGVQSGLIATNGKELAALKALGERNYFEFNLRKTKKPQRVGDIAIRLRKADPKHNRYTIDVLADDKQTEKKDKSLNEPVQFYTAKARQPYEIVVNQVKKNEIIGYLSTPKVQLAR